MSVAGCISDFAVAELECGTCDCLARCEEAALAHDSSPDVLKTSDRHQIGREGLKALLSRRYMNAR